MDEGLRPITDVLKARAEVASRLGEVAAAQEAVRNAEDQLRLITNLPGEAGEWEQRLAPTTALDRAPYAADVRVALQEARANRPELKAAAQQALDTFGVGPGAVRSIAGTMSLHNELERTLTDFKGCGDTLAVQSGLVANQAAIPSVIDSKEDGIFTDELNHASIIDGVRLIYKAQRFIYKHCDPDDLKAKLEEGKHTRRKLIITDGVFSMDGDLAPLPEICDLADHYDAFVMVDDAHGEGVLGKGGALSVLQKIRSEGICDHVGITGHDAATLLEAAKTGEFETIQGAFSYLEREQKILDLVDYCHEHDIGFIVQKPLAGGAIAPVDAALKWLLSFPVSTVIPGMVSVEQVVENAAVGFTDAVINDEERGRLDDLVGSLGNRFWNRFWLYICHYRFMF